MACIKEMLKDEIRTSGEFSKRNFGLQMGDDWPDMVKELTHSNIVVAVLSMGMMKSILGIPQFAMHSEATDPDTMQRVMLDNLDMFMTPLQMFYWGIQVGRKLQKEESETLQKMERENGAGKVCNDL
jgi:hypothetical protein